MNNEARDFLPRANFQCRLSFGVRTPPCAIACITICAHDKDPVVHVRVRWIMAKQIYQARTISDKYNQLDDCGRSSAMGMLLEHGYVRALYIVIIIVIIIIINIIIIIIIIIINFSLASSN